MKGLRRNQKLNIVLYIVLIAILTSLLPLLTLTNPGVLDKFLGLKIMAYEITRISAIGGSCDNLTAYQSEIMVTYIYGRDGKPICGANGAPVNMANNKKARDPSWEQLVWFLKCDDTDKQKYIDNVFNCIDYAEMLQNHAAKAGWKAAFVGFHMRDNVTDNITGHAINAFQTTDHGLVYIDCSRYEDETAYDADKLVNVKVNELCRATYIFPTRIPDKVVPGFWDYPSGDRYRVLSIDLIEWPLTEW